MKWKGKTRNLIFCSSCHNKASGPLLILTALSQKQRYSPHARPQFYFILWTAPIHVLHDVLEPKIIDLCGCFDRISHIFVKNVRHHNQAKFPELHLLRAHHIHLPWSQFLSHECCTINCSHLVENAPILPSSWSSLKAVFDKLIAGLLISLCSSQVLPDDCSVDGFWAKNCPWITAQSPHLIASMSLQ